MSQKRGVLLASFLLTESDEDVQTEVEFIVNNIEITNNMIFLLEEVENPAKKILTYNAITEPGKPFNPRLYTMRVHRKKQTNTLYTINALNKAVASQHDGKTGKHLKLDWEPIRELNSLDNGKRIESP
jgi:hypothetical protein